MGRRTRIPRMMREQWRKTYDQTSYRDLPWFSPRPYPWILVGVREHWFRPRTKVLDLGCGAGTNALFLARSGYRTSGVDLAPGAIEAARRRASRAHLKIDFRVGDVLGLPFRKGEFGGATDIGCFHTIPRRLRRAYAKEVARLVRPGGTYLLSWVAREHAGPLGPPHRPSVEEVASVFEDAFLMRHCEFRDGSRNSIAVYNSLLERRIKPRPAAR